jgi:hypothetical protein
MTSVSAAALNLGGCTDLPFGKVAAIATDLKMRKPPAMASIQPPEGWTP